MDLKNVLSNVADIGSVLSKYKRKNYIVDIENNNHTAFVTIYVNRLDKELNKFEDLMVELNDVISIINKKGDVKAYVYVEDTNLIFSGNQNGFVNIKIRFSA